MNINQAKFQYVMKKYYLDGDVIYRRDTHEVVPFNSKSQQGHRCKTVSINGKRIAITIHEAVWVLHNNKPIPDGDFHIHHKDFDVENNAPDNLVLMSRRMHQVYHRHINGSKGYSYCAAPSHHLNPWHANIYLPIGRSIEKWVTTEAEAQAFVAYHRAPVIKAFQAMGLPV